MIKTKSIPLFMLQLFLLAGCAGPAGRFTQQEENIITSGQESMLMRLYTVDDPDDLVLLRKQALPVTKEMSGSELFSTLCERMLATVNDPEQTGVGIAAPQVGISRALVAVQRFDKEGYPFEFYANPEITSYGENKVKGQEGCLSVPDKSGIVERSSEIIIEYNDPQSWERKKETVNGFTAIIFQHETDHLNGIIYTDKCEPVAETEAAETGQDE